LQQQITAAPPTDWGRRVDQLRTILRKVWGFDDFRPLQAEAMQSVVSGRDSVVVLPTGGGKSLCFQAPALAMEGLGVVVSPLISLMKDQVDALADSGVPAAAVNSMIPPDEKRRIAHEIKSGRLKLLYLSPETLMTERMLQFLRETPVSFFAIDEAHCISDWGHDFRPEYRMLRALKETFPQVGVHAYTATATERVRHDIARELNLHQPEILVGSFDRPNLVYRVARRSEMWEQIQEVVGRHPDESGIIYCIRRKDVDSLAASLAEAGHSALPYHAGLDDATRKKNQDDFINDRAKIIVATVAFGMGIDKSDVRYVIHAGAPKSLEHYQQESGRAGRDGLEAECVLLFSGADFLAWKKLQAELPLAANRIAMEVLKGIEDFCGSVVCRHRSIVEYFGQQYPGESCGACDVCLSEIAVQDGALVIAQKILSSVLRQGQNFGGEYTAQVLTGSRDQRIVENGHDKLSTWGLLTEHGRRSVRDWIEQLAGQGFLQRTGEYNVLTVTAEGRRVLKGEITPRLLQAPEPKKKEAKFAAASWEGVDRGLFEVLRALRREKAAARGIAPFIVFSDATLRGLARVRPSSLANLLQVQGIGEKKAAEYGGDFLAAIAAYCREQSVTQDVFDSPAGSEEKAAKLGPTTSSSKRRAIELFLQGKSIDDVCQAVSRAPSTVSEYLVDAIALHGISDHSPWLSDDLYARIRAAATQHGADRLKPLKEALGDSVSYDEIKIALACLRNAAPEA
jgi:ATP-dependent DNA helicase RecQ